MLKTDAHFALDPGKAETFAATLLTALNHAALCLMMSIGHRTGLFDVMSGMPPSSSREIAAAAGLHERYVREWLGAMVTGRVVETHADTGRFSLPAEHAASLTRSAGAGNMTVVAQYFAVLGGVEDEIVACFKQGGGVPYTKFPRFHEVMAEDSEQSVLSSLESRVLPLVPGVADQLARGIRVLDVGCGRGRIINRLAKLYPASEFVGMDLSEEATTYARKEAAAQGLTNVEFVERDVSDFDRSAEPAAYDFITTFDAVHDQAQPLSVLRGIHRALRPDGVYLMQDIKGSSHVHKNLDHPLATLLYTVSCMHCMTVSLAQGGEGLGAMWGEEKTREYLRRAGFRSVEKRDLTHDTMNNWYIVRR
jgi:2-polyprenyl-3-methyl-5-hydroxy-6-metoxy-1,4-benzoquinol methylase